MDREKIALLELIEWDLKQAMEGAYQGKLHWAKTFVESARYKCKNPHLEFPEERARKILNTAYTGFAEKLLIEARDIAGEGEICETIKCLDYCKSVCDEGGIEYPVERDEGIMRIAHTNGVETALRKARDSAEKGLVTEALGHLEQAKQSANEVGLALPADRVGRIMSIASKAGEFS